MTADTLAQALGAASILVAGIATTLHAALTKRDPRAAIGWVAVCLLFPIGGPLFYVVFGINRIRSRASRLSRQLGHRLARERRDFPPRHDSSAETVHPPLGLQQVSDALSPFRALPGNQVSALYNGEQCYPAMLEAINGAREQLWLTTFIFQRDALGTRFIEALGAAAARGVDVRVLIDGVGELYGLPRVARRELQRRGVQVARFLPPRLWPPAIYINLRTHRKLLIVDRKTGFIGGMNIGERHLAEQRSPPSRKRDVHFRVAGPVVNQLATVFADDWRFSCGEALDAGPAPASPTAAQQARGALCRTFIDGPDHSLDSLHLLILGVIGCASRRVQIMTPYFLPSRKVVGALQAAALRGVDVQVLLPAHSNLPFVDWASRKMLVELVERDVRVGLQPAPFAHSKLLLVDEAHVLVGSANLDPRSLRLNFEVMLEVTDAALGEELSAHIDTAWRSSTPVTVDSLAADSLAVRTRNAFAWLFSPYL